MKIPRAVLDLLDRIEWAVTRKRTCELCGCLCLPDEFCPACRVVAG